MLRAAAAKMKITRPGKDPWPWLLLAMAVGYTVYFWSNPHGYPLYAGDARSYLRFDPDRTAGYPVFLDAVIAVFGAVEAVPRAQVVLSAAALAFLGWCMRRAFRSPVLALMPICVPVFVEKLGRYHAAIGTESLFVSLLCVMLGALILLVTRPSWRAAAASALACGLMIAVRPAGLSVLSIWPFALWFVWAGGRCAGRRARMAAAVAAPIALCLVIESLTWRAEHGSAFRPSRVDVHLYAKAFLLGPEPAAPDGAPAGFVAEHQDLLAPLRALIAEAPDLQTRIFLLEIFEFGAQRAADRQVFHRTEPHGRKRFRAAPYRIVRQVGWASAAASPLAWAGNALAHYLGYWIVYAYHDLDFVRRFHAYIEPLDDHPYFGTPEFMPHPDRRGRRQVMVGAMAAALAASLLAPGLAVWRRLRDGPRPPDGRLVVAGVCGLLVHGHLLAASLFGMAVMRYVVTMWPAMLVCGLLLLHYSLGSVRGRSAVRGSASASSTRNPAPAGGRPARPDR